MVVFIIAGVLILWNAFIGFSRGAIRSVAHLAGLAGAVLLSPKLADLFQPLVVRYVTHFISQRPQRFQSFRCHTSSSMFASSISA